MGAGAQRAEWPLRRGQKCKHCGWRKRRPEPWSRGLCYYCVALPGVKAQYPAAVYAPGTRQAMGQRRPEMPHESDSPPPRVVIPCLRPGSEEKVQVMCWRAELGESLCDPGEPHLLEFIEKICRSRGEALFAEAV